MFSLIVISFASNAQLKGKTKILVLGTPHLEQIEGFESAYLKKLLDSLKHKKFDVVAIESMSSELLLDIKSRKEKHWQGLYDNFKKRVETGLQCQKESGYTFEEARGKILTLNSLNILSDSNRVEYIKSFLCTYDSWSALLHFKELKNKAILDKLSADLLERLLSSKNEINLIGLEIAKAMNLRQVSHIDNLQDETILLNDFPAFMTEYQSESDNIVALLSENKLFEKQAVLEKEALKKKDFYSVYKFYNSEEYIKADFEGQWAVWFKTNFKSKTDRSRYSLWEMRNLLVAANILRVAASNPGKKILVIIGASHKGFLEKYLKQIIDIEILKLN